MATFHTVYLGDPLSATVIPSLWAQLEELVGIFAVCPPRLKSPAERVLRRLGVLSDQLTQSISLPSSCYPVGARVSSVSSRRNAFGRSSRGR